MDAFDPKIMKARWALSSLIGTVKGCRQIRATDSKYGGENDELVRHLDAKIAEAETVLRELQA